MKAQTSEFARPADLKSLLGASGPCVSIYLALAPLPGGQVANTNRLAWRETIHQVQGELQNLAPEGPPLFESLAEWESIAPETEPQAKGIAVFRSPTIFHITSMHEPVTNRAVVGPHFYIRPLLPELQKAHFFYLLALSQKDVRLLRCSLHSAEEVSLPAHAATSYDAYMNLAKPDHVSIDRASAGPSGGHTKGVVASYNTIPEKKGEYLDHFFKQIDHAVNEVLRGNSDPLVLAGVDYELAQYRELNSYPHLSQTSVQGAPNSLKSGEMHARALAALAADVDKRADEVLAEYNHKVGSGASSHIKEVVTAAHDGRVLRLLLSDSLVKTGTFDEARHTVRGHASSLGQEEDLLNDAAIQTILHAGEVLSLTNKKMPNGAPLAAIFRY